MYNQTYIPIAKITDNQRKKHYTMFSNDEKLYLIDKLNIVKTYAILSEHLQLKNNGITIRDINNVFNSNNFEMIEYNETTRNNITDLRVLIRSVDTYFTSFYDTTINYSYNCYCHLCFVISIKTGQVVTAYFNKSGDTHKTIDLSRYENLQIIK